MNENVKKLCAAWRGPRSVCVCGHTGDGSDSDHTRLFTDGHGACRECECAQFVWAGFSPVFTAALDRQKGAK